MAGLAAAGGALLPGTAQADAIASTAVDTARAKAKAALGPARTARPTGADYIRYEDLYRSGDTVAAALARLTSSKIVTFPEGKFSCRDFNTGYQAGIAVPALCRGIVGSGPGTLGGSSGTVFTMTTRSSTKNTRTYIPVQGTSSPVQLYVMKQANQKVPGVWKNFQVAGTDQGHIFGAFQVFETAGANVFQNLLISGWEGNNGAPPGETMGLAVSGQGAHTMTQIEADGRRAVGGQVFGATGMTFQNSVGATFRNCYSHHVRTANYVMFQSVNGTMVDCVADALSAGSYGIGNGGINLERTAGWTVVNPVMIGRSNKVHLSHSNDNWTFNRYGTYKTVRNGSLKVVNPIFNDLWGNKAFYLQSWTPYWNGDTMSTPPLVTKSDWATHFPYKWIHGTGRDIK
jgi:hypothetical protein